MSSVPPPSPDSVDLLGDGRILKDLIAAGTGDFPHERGWCKIHYRCSLAESSDGTELDSTWDRGCPLTLTLGEHEVNPGLERAVVSMRTGETANFKIHQDLAWGCAGVGGGVVPGGDAGALKFEVELVETGHESGFVDETDAHNVGVSLDERLHQAMRAKEAGNVNFKASRTEMAVEAYEGALKLLGVVSSEGHAGCAKDEEQDAQWWKDTCQKESRDRLIVSCLLNLAQCDLKLERLLAAQKNTTLALDIDPSNSKALYRRGSAFMSLGFLERARGDFAEAARREPRNAEIRGKLQECMMRLQKSEKCERSTFGGMFDRGSIYSESKA